MRNKVLVELIIPEIDETYNVYIPINKTIGETIALLNKAVYDLSDGIYNGGNKNFIYNKDTGEKYDINKKVYDTDIRNGTGIILI